MIIAGGASAARADPADANPATAKPASAVSDAAIVLRGRSSLVMATRLLEDQRIVPKSEVD
jgi:hypothetical protein